MEQKKSRFNRILRGVATYLAYLLAYFLLLGVAAFVSLLAFGGASPAMGLLATAAKIGVGLAIVPPVLALLTATWFLYQQVKDERRQF